MKRFVFGILLVSTTMLGCAQNHFNISAENYAEKVKVIGVAPIFIDTDSDIIHPQKELLIPIIADLNRKYEPFLVSKLQSTGNYFAVKLLADEPRQLFSSLMARREKREDANTIYNKYFWKNDDIGAYLRKNHLDAVMVIVVSGLTKSSKIYSSNLLTSLETNYNFLTITAQILGPDGTVLWEYPNFRGRLLPYYPLVNLQYPDFSESEANVSRTTVVRFKSVDGIRRTLEQKRNDLLMRETQEPDVYGRLFDEITSLVRHSVEKQTKGAADSKLQPPAEESSKSVTAIGPAPVPVSTPAAKAPAQVPVPAKTIEAPAIPLSPSNEIVPATESTR